jgi:hypothetical protein
MFDKHETRLAASFALPNTGKITAARMAMIAITTRSSMSVNARRAGIPSSYRNSARFGPFVFSLYCVKKLDFTSETYWVFASFVGMQSAGFTFTHGVNGPLCVCG